MYVWQDLKKNGMYKARHWHNFWGKNWGDSFFFSSPLWACICINRKIVKYTFKIKMYIWTQWQWKLKPAKSKPILNVQMILQYQSNWTSNSKQSRPLVKSHFNSLVLSISNRIWLVGNCKCQHIYMLYGCGGGV